MKRCTQCKNLMPDDVSRCVRCGHDSSKDLSPTTSSDATPHSIEQKSVSKGHSINWLRVCATVLASDLFFLASCTTGMSITVLSGSSDDYGPEITESRRPSKFITVIATVPDTERQGQHKSVVVPFSRLDEFKAKNPDYSFLLPPGEGRVDNVTAWTKYSVTASEPGKVIVKSHFHRDVPPFGLPARQRYEATDKSVKLLNAKAGFFHGWAIIVGLAFATVLAIAGRILKRRLEPEKLPLSAADLSAAKAIATKRTLKTLAVAIAIGLLLFSALMIFSFGG